MTFQLCRPLARETDSVMAKPFVIGQIFASIFSRQEVILFQFSIHSQHQTAVCWSGGPGNIFVRPPRL